MNTFSIRPGQLPGGAPRFPQSQNVARTMSSIDLRDMINDARLLAGEPKVRNDQFLSRVEDELGDELQGVQKYYTPVHGNQVATYSLTLDQCMLVGMRESKAVRRSVLKKLKELEGPRIIATLPDFSNPVAAARAWADQVELQQQASQALIEAAPKVAFHDMVVVSHKTYNAAQAAKLIGTGRTRLLQFMRQNGWITRSNEPYQAKIEAGLLDVKLGTFEHPIQGTIPTCSTLITGKGLTKLEALWRERDADLLA